MKIIVRKIICNQIHYMTTNKKKIRFKTYAEYLGDRLCRIIYKSQLRTVTKFQRIRILKLSVQEETQIYVRTQVPALRIYLKLFPSFVSHNFLLA